MDDSRPLSHLTHPSQKRARPSDFVLFGFLLVLTATLGLQRGSRLSRVGERLVRDEAKLEQPVDTAVRRTTECVLLYDIMCWIQNTAKNIVLHSCVCAPSVDTRRHDGRQPWSREAAPIPSRELQLCWGTWGSMDHSNQSAPHVFIQTNTSRARVKVVAIISRHIRINYPLMIKITLKSLFTLYPLLHQYLSLHLFMFRVLLFSLTTVMQPETFLSSVAT